MENDNPCPRCGAGRLRAWSELSGEEQELVKRLPASADFSLEERKASHRWCSRCWHETGGGAARV
jgi:ribosomal protein S27AE